MLFQFAKRAGDLDYRRSGNHNSGVVCINVTPSKTKNWIWQCVSIFCFCAKSSHGVGLGLVRVRARVRAKGKRGLRCTKNNLENMAISIYLVLDR